MSKTRETFVITTIKSPSWDDEEVKRRLGRAYALILTYQAEKEATDRREFDDLTREAGQVTASHEALLSVPYHTTRKTQEEEDCEEARDE